MPTHPDPRRTPDRRVLDALGQDLDRVDHDLDSERLRLTELVSERKRLERLLADPGTTAATGRRLQSRLDRVRGEQARVHGEVAGLLEHHRDLRNRFDGLVVQSDPLAGHDGSVPIALLPVRLETRFVGDELRVRIFPDVVHVDQHEPLLTDEEAAFGEAWWRQRWDATDEVAAALWESALEGRRPGRVAWVLRATRPTNHQQLGHDEPLFASAPRRDAAVTTPPRARLLPSRWLVVGSRGDAEVVRAWSALVTDPLATGMGDPDTDAANLDVDAPPDVQDELAIDEATRWLVDFDAAVAAGMAVTIRAGDVDGGLAAGFDRLTAVGVAAGTPAGRAAEFERLLEAHHFTDGVDHVPAGTPTNADDADAIPDRPRPGRPDRPAVAVGADGAGARLAGAFGLPSSSTLNRVPAAEHRHDPLAGAMATALWEPTLGYFLRQVLEPLVPDELASRIRDHFRLHVRPRGPFAPLRVGAQPYGILPVTSLRHHRGDETETILASMLRRLRPLWVLAARSSRQLGSGDDPGADLVHLLQRSSRSSHWRVRSVLGPGTVANTTGWTGLFNVQQSSAHLLFAILGVEGRPAVVDWTLQDDQVPLPVPLVTGAGTEATAPLTDDYVARILRDLRSAGDYARAVGEPSRATTLLEALLVHAAKLEVARASATTILDHLQIHAPLQVALREREIALPTSSETAKTATAKAATVAKKLSQVHVEDAGTVSARLNLDVGELAHVAIPELTGRLGVAEWLLHRTDRDLVRLPGGGQIAEFRGSLEALVGAPTKALHDTTADVLDAVSHRFDAWETSLATRRLHAQRDTGVAGLHVGAYGWVENLRPAAGPVSHGFVHAPSVPHAATAAVLRSGHLARRDPAAAEATAIDLSSRRVRTAMKLVDGLRQGQPLGALLGYQFERALRDRDVELVEYVLDIRREHPLGADTDPRAPRGPVATTAVRNVVNGAELAELDDAGRQRLLDRAGVDAAHRPALIEEIDRLGDALDALGDLLLSESVFQMVAGNADRAAAAMSALDRQQLPPDIQVARTPSAATGVDHHLLLVLDDTTPPAGWSGLSDLRARVAPRVNAWVGHALGDPTRYHLAADVLDADGEVLATITVGLEELGLSPLSTVLAAVRGGPEGSELQGHLAARLTTAVTDERAVGLRAHDGPAPGGPSDAMGLTDLVLLARRLADLLGSARSLAPEDLAGQDAGDDPAGWEAKDVAEVQTRADVAAAFVADLAGVTDVGSLTISQLRSRRRQGVELGIRETQALEDDRDGLRAQVEAAVEIARSLQARHDEVVATFTAHQAEVATGGGEVSALEQVRFHTTRIQTLLGDDVPVVVPVTTRGEARGRFALAAGDPALVDDEPFAPTEFLLAHARVRPSVGRLWDVFGQAELFGTGVDATQLVIGQTPHRPGTPWVGRRLGPADGAPLPTTSWLLHRRAEEGARHELPERLHALVIDQWHELVPSTERTTGVAVHHDAPGARPPQAILLAVPPDPDAAHWRLDVLLDVVGDTIELARMRTLDIDDLPLAGRVLPATYLAFDLENKTASFGMQRLVEHAVKTWGMVEVDR
ncbi:hypothetical protein [Egicoccus halophilus]|uniref:Uncharacterized protein n=1 Tax=Egicoccus halophilus TaxID=1670830 RepID=A0A8J3A5H8_9ACTN|nr:hypothetical protein [Egicoccus halophilus]GGI03574.1 hypothetical protein GCM10011354_04710 [Egicoccus halophilus]